MDTEFEKLIETLTKIQGLTKKTAERMSIDLISHQEKFNQFLTELTDFKQNFGLCPRCFYLTYQNVCEVCADPSRDQNLIIVVSSVLDALKIEKYQKIKGLYAILGGEINLNKNISPVDLKIENLFERVNPQTELLLALNATFEGELTANYLMKIALKKNLKVSRIGKGIPMGGMLDYMDEETLTNAFNNRK